MDIPKGNPMYIPCKECFSFAVCLAEIECEMDFGVLMNYAVTIPPERIKKCEYLQQCNTDIDTFIFYKRFVLQQKGLL